MTDSFGVRMVRSSGDNDLLVIEVAFLLVEVAVEVEEGHLWAARRGAAEVVEVVVDQVLPTTAHVN